MSVLGDPSAKVGSSAKFGVAAFKVSILNLLGGPLAILDNWMSVAM